MNRWNASLEGQIYMFLSYHPQIPTMRVLREFYGEDAGAAERARVQKALRRLREKNLIQNIGFQNRNAVWECCA